MKKIKMFRSFSYEDVEGAMETVEVVVSCPEKNIEKRFDLFYRDFAEGNETNEQKAAEMNTAILDKSNELAEKIIQEIFSVEVAAEKESEDYDEMDGPKTELREWEWSERSEIPMAKAKDFEKIY
jgi:hypothetical protein